MKEWTCISILREGNYLNSNYWNWYDFTDFQYQYMFKGSNENNEIIKFDWLNFCSKTQFKRVIDNAYPVDTGRKLTYIRRSEDVLDVF